jgi:phosphate transport system substrate-binding protein
MNHRLVALLPILAALLVALPSPPARAESTVRIGGTGSGTGGMRLLARAFMSATPAVTVDVQTAVGSAGGIGAVIDGRLDLAVSNREPNEKEKALSPLLTVEYARTPFVVALRKDLQVRALTSDQLAGLYAPGSTTFPNGRRARPVLRLSDAGDTRLLQSFSPAVASAVEAASIRPGMLNANTDSETADMLEKTPGAFAVSTLALIESEARPLTALDIDGRHPSVANLANGSYPYFKSLFLVVGPGAGPNARAFADFVRSEEGRKLLTSHGHWVR